ncbi:MAG: hypothetical protein ABL897_03755 [Hyphomicrobium sp.]
MKRWIKLLVLTIATYFVAWTFAYMSIMGANFKYYGDYLVLAWTGGLEIVTFIQIFALIPTMCLIPIYWWLLRQRR